MKKLFYTLLLFGPISLWSTALLAQTDTTTRPSPLVETDGVFHDAQLTIEYSSPAVKGRTIWGDLVPYGKVWRTGANEATTFEIDQDILIQGELLPAGKYGLFTIPAESEWTIIFNSEWNQWGAYKYDENKDVLRINVKPLASPVFYERMAFVIDDDMVSLNWENLKIRLN